MELIILIGLQGAGKSSFCRVRFADTSTSAKTSSPGWVFVVAERHLLDAALQAGQSVVVDNTNATAEQRAELIFLGWTYRARIVGYYFESRVKDCWERNRQRAGKERVPDVALYTTIKRL
jgi:predicted kinase